MSRGGQWLRRGWQWGSAIGLTSPKKHQLNYTFSRILILITQRGINVVLTFNAEAIAELAGRLR
jgi:hypothetical protein